MATETSTIRVTRATRDLLAEQARECGMSLAAARTAISDGGLGRRSCGRTV